MSRTEYLYVNNFWGEKHHGHHVMYENLRKGEEVATEFVQFLKERSQYEDDAQKQLLKNANRVSSFISHGSNFAPGWALARGTIELLAEIHGAYFKSIQELVKEVTRYQDDFSKTRKKAKEQDVVDTVNLMQTTTTCLQKAKETYMSRFNELEKLRRDSTASAKEVAKTESKLLKAKDEYRQYVEKYEQIRVQYERKMENAATIFQALDMDHYSSLRQFLLTYAVQQQETLAAAMQVCSQFRESVQALEVHQFVENFVKKAATGKDRPQAVVFEDLDGLMSHGGDDSERSAGTSQPSSCNSSQVVKTEQPVLPPTAHDLLVLDVPSTWNSNEENKAASTKMPSPSGSDDSSNQPPSALPPPPPQGFSTSFGGSAGKKLSMWLPKRNSRKTASQSSIPDSEEPGVVGGFLKFRKNSKKKSQLDLSAPIDKENADDAQSTASSCRSDEKQANGVLSTHSVDADGYSIRPSEDRKDRPDWSSCSSSDEDENEMQKSRIRALTIKPAAVGAARNSSVDELRDAIGSITLGRSATFDKDPWSVSTTRAPFSQSLGGVKPLRAAHTGDEHLRSKFNESDFARSNVPLSFSSSVGAAAVLGMARARPRSNTPNLPMGKRDSMGSQDWSAQLGGLVGGEGSMSSLSNSTLDLMAASEYRVPVAMAINEYCHVWFKGSDTSQKVVRVFGTVMISFAAASIPLLTDLNNSIEPLSFRLASTDKIKAVLPNKEFLITTAGDGYRYSFDRQALAKWLQAQQESRPGTQFFNAEVLRYELKEDETLEPPLTVLSYWKTEAETTDIFIEYRLNIGCPVTATLLNVSLATIVNGGVENVITDPSADWQAGTSTLSWLLTEISRAGQTNGSLKARLRLAPGGGPSTPAQTHVSFHCVDSSISGASVQLDPSDVYHLSMVRRKLFAGKYFCDPEVKK
ncbi:unnamed protein product, partial [Mesorhabditis spiculigera]